MGVLGIPADDRLLFFFPLRGVPLLPACGVCPASFAGDLTAVTEGGGGGVLVAGCNFARFRLPLVGVVGACC